MQYGFCVYRAILFPVRLENRRKNATKKDSIMSGALSHHTAWYCRTSIVPARLGVMSGRYRVFVLFKNSDMTEGRGPMLIHSIWTDEEQAKIFMDAQTDTTYSLSDQAIGDIRAEARQSALAKLSSADKIALGLTA
jgi:hypothetical protein